ncbi:MAG: hypothetical protein ACYC3S_13245 [Chloroflexota bacterium]
MSTFSRRLARHATESNYMKRIAKASADCPELFTPGEVMMLEVQHDDWCSFWKGEPCDCRPTMRLKNMEVSVDGHS